MDIIQNLPKNKLLIIICKDPKDRKILHNYIEQVDKTIKKKSLKSYLVSDERNIYRIRCCCCNSPMVKLDQYHPGYMENNEDESRSGTCYHCGEIIWWECAYDNIENITYVDCNNIVVIGEYMSNKQRKSTEVDSKSFVAVMQQSKYYIIDAPDMQLNKNKLQDYINKKLKELIK